MKKYIKIGSIILSVITIISIITILYLYSTGKILSDVRENTYNKAFVNIKFGENLDEPLYAKAHFISNDKIVMLYAGKLSKNCKFEAVDAYGKEYSIKKLKNFEYFSVLYTNEKNINDINYKYALIDKYKYLYAAIKSDDFIAKYDVLSYNKYPNGYKVLTCAGMVEDISGGPVVDEYGRIVGMLQRDANIKDIFYVYPHSEIMKKVIISDLKDFFGIE